MFRKVVPRLSSQHRQRASSFFSLRRHVSTGLVGLPNVGKSSLFNALTASTQEVANYPFATIEPTSGYCPVFDPRLFALARVMESRKTLPASLEFVDIAGLVKGASEGKGLGNKFLSNIRNCDAIVHVARCYDDEDIVHVHSKVDPVDDIAVIELELVIADLQQATKRIEKVRKLTKNGGKLEFGKDELPALEKLVPHLDAGESARRLLLDGTLNEEEMAAIKHMNLLSMKPMIYAANLSEDDFKAYVVSGTVNEHMTALQQQLVGTDARVVPVSCAMEAELVELSPEERTEYQEEVGGLTAENETEFGLKKLTREVYAMLQLETFFTAGPTESRAWPFRKGYTAPQCAGLIHTDLEKGYIRADTVRWNNLVDSGGEKQARDAGHYVLNGKEYLVQDGDVLIIRHNS